MIPKVIHYIWFGGNPLPELTQKCIRSWEKYCPDYEIKRWDESNFDVNENQYCSEAYKAKKWAFVSDYARVKILYEEGGIYMDTDVELTKNIDEFLDDEAFSGFEDDVHISTGIMAACKGQRFFKILVEDYNDRHFIDENGNMNKTTNVEVITKYAKRYGFIPNGQKQTIEGFTVYPKDYFCPKHHTTHELNITENTAAIHHFDGSWLSPGRVWRVEFIKKYHKRFGLTLATFLSKVCYVIKSGNIKGLVKWLYTKARYGKGVIDD